ncbi:hypothetical protein Tco_0007546 [Tanacetum coccineum]
MTIYGRVMTFYQDKKAAGVGLVFWRFKVLMDSPEVNDVVRLVVHMFVDKKYPLSVNLIERMLDHQLEICHGTMGNELTTAVQGIYLVFKLQEKQLVSAQSLYFSLMLELLNFGSQLPGIRLRINKVMFQFPDFPVKGLIRASRESWRIVSALRVAIRTRFLDNKLEEGERMWRSIEKGPYVRPMIIDPDDTRKQIIEPLSKMTEINKKQYIADVRVMIFLSLAIPNDIYNQWMHKCDRKCGI